MPTALNRGQIEARVLLKDLSVQELRDLSKQPATLPIGGEPFTSQVWETQSGSIVFTTKVRNRSKKLTYIVEYPETPLGTRQDGISVAESEALCQQVRDYLKDQEVVEVNRQMGQGNRSYACRLYITKPFSRIAYMWYNTMSDMETEREPDFVSVYVPEWPERKIVADMKNKISWILGTDYLGEAKKSFLRQAMYQAKHEGGLGLHAGSKELVVTNHQTGKLQDVGIILFGLSGTGKTTLTIHNHDLKDPEKVFIRQDDVILMDKNGYCRGTERGFFLKTEGLSPEGQDVLYRAAMAPDAAFENVMVKGGQGGPLDFEDVSMTSNGRGVILRSDVEVDESIDLKKANAIVFITRRTDVVPGVAKLTPEQAGAAFMLGESIETSAGDPTKAGQPKRSVGTNPFIVGPEADEGNRMMDIIRANPDMKAYLLNTGTVGEKKDPTTGKILDAGHKVKITESTTLLREIARDSITWELDPISQYWVPQSVEGLDWKALDPRTYYTEDEYKARFATLRTERHDWLAQFPGVHDEIKNAI